MASRPAKRPFVITVGIDGTQIKLEMLGAKAAGELVAAVRQAAVERSTYTFELPHDIHAIVNFAQVKLTTVDAQEGTGAGINIRR